MTRKRKTKRSSQANSKGKSDQRSRSSLHVVQREVMSVLLASFSCFLFFAVISHNPFLVSAKEVGLSFFLSVSSVFLTSDTAANIMGPAGDSVAAALFGAIGLPSILLPFFFLGYVISGWVLRTESRDGSAQKHERYSWTRRSLLWALILCLCSGGLSVLFAKSSGGVVGEQISSVLTGLFGHTGSLLILGTGIFLLGYYLAGDALLFAAQKFALFVVTAISKSFSILIQLAGYASRVLFSFCRKGTRFAAQGLLALWGIVGVGVRFFRQWRAKAALRREERRKVQAAQAREVSAQPAPVAAASLKTPTSPPSPGNESRIVVVDHSKPLEAAPKRAGKSPSTPVKREETVKREEAMKREELAEDPFSTFEFPETDLLREVPASKRVIGKDELLERSKVIQAKLLDFNVAGQITHVHPGPVITMYEFEPAPGIKVGKITSLQDDLAMALRAPSIRIIAPLPERGSVGIEVPNEAQEVVLLRELLEFDGEEVEAARLPVPLGKDTFGAPVTGYIADMPHLLLAGATGTGKSVCINAILVSLLYRAHPSELQLILIDPKILELSVYEGIPHLKVPVVTDPRKAKAVLQWAVQEMDDRYKMLRQYGVRNIDAFNDLVSGKTVPDEHSTKVHPERIIIEELEPLPKIMIVIDELADLMLTSGREVEELITRLAQKARAAGIHLLLATQRPSVDVITGLIKANFPARVSFRVSSRVDSRTILDTMGAERLLGKGDMLFLRPGAHALQRVHGAFVSDQEVRKVTRFLRDSCKPEYDTTIMEMCEKALEDSGASLEPGEADTSDPLYDKAVQVVLERGQASTSMIQRAFRIGYNRAARIVDTMEQEGLVGPMDGAKPRQVLVPQASSNE